MINWFECGLNKVVYKELKWLKKLQDSSGIFISSKLVDFRQVQKVKNQLHFGDLQKLLNSQ